MDDKDQVKESYRRLDELRTALLKELNKEGDSEIRDSLFLASHFMGFAFIHLEKAIYLRDKYSQL
ncbi:MULTISPECIES: hypothetical protein [unclassified Microcoleus]|uniref:hypothetical protein n=1 Tax=unclassified Microcoleus TaxID=2642155 RepID=UPI002FD32236